MTVGTGIKEREKDVIEVRFDNLDEYKEVQDLIRKILTDWNKRWGIAGLDDFSKALCERIGYRKPVVDEKPVVKFICNRDYSVLFLKCVFDMIRVCSEMDKEIEREKTYREICEGSDTIKETDPEEAD